MQPNVISFSGSVKLFSQLQENKICFFVCFLMLLVCFPVYFLLKRTKKSGKGKDISLLTDIEHRKDRLEKQLNDLFYFPLFFSS